MTLFCVISGRIMPQWPVGDFLFLEQSVITGHCDCVMFIRVMGPSE